MSDTDDDIDSILNLAQGKEEAPKARAKAKPKAKTTKTTKKSKAKKPRLDSDVETSEEETSEDDRRRDSSDESVESDYSEDRATRGRKRLTNRDKEEAEPAVAFDEAKHNSELEKLNQDLQDKLDKQREAREELQYLGEVEREAKLAAMEEQISDLRNRIEVKKRIIKQGMGADRVPDRLQGLAKKHGRTKKREVDDYMEIHKTQSKTQPKPKKEKEMEAMDFTLSDLHAACVTRHDLVKWDYFEHLPKTISKAYVRYLVGPDPKTRTPVYRLCRIEAVVDGEKTYQLEKERKQESRHYLALSHGKAQKNFSMDNVSNRLPTEEEFRRWEKTMKADKVPFPYKEDLQKIANNLRSQREKEATADDVEKMIQAKKEIQRGPVNYAAEKTKLTLAYKKAEADGRREEASLLKKKLEKVEQASMPEEKDDAWKIINQRNRKMRFAQGQAAEELMRKQARAISPGKSPQKEPIRLPALGKDLDVDGEMQQDANGYYRPESQRVLRMLRKTQLVLSKYLDEPGKVQINVESDEEDVEGDNGVAKSLFELALAEYDLGGPVPMPDEIVL